MPGPKSATENSGSSSRIAAAPSPNAEAPTLGRAWNTVAIVGVGLIGGSLGLALRERKLAREVIGVGRTVETLRVAQKMGAVTQIALDLDKAAGQADLIVVCTPVGRIAEDVLAAGRACPPGALITDVGSTKERIVRELSGKLKPGVTFVGGHPLAGSEKSGPAAAQARLFERKIVVVTPEPDTPEPACQAVESLWRTCGAVVRRMSPRDHDEALAETSHLPHFVASALARTTAAERLALTASGWLDSTRVAAGDPALWRQIFLANREHLLAALDRYQASLAELRQAVEGNLPDRLENLLLEAKQTRDAVGN